MEASDTAAPARSGSEAASENSDQPAGNVAAAPHVTVAPAAPAAPAASAASDASLAVLHSRLAQATADQSGAVPGPPVSLPPAAPNAAPHGIQQSAAQPDAPIDTPKPQPLQPGVVPIMLPAAPAHAVRAVAGANAEPPGGVMAGEAAGPLPTRLLVACGDLHGHLDMTKPSITTHEGHVMKPTDFEVMSGISGNNKWKQSMRVVLPDGTLGQTVQQWMAAHGFKPKKRVLPQPRPKRPPSDGKAAQPARPAAAARAAPLAPPHPQKATGQEVLAHLSRQYIGLLPSDATAPALAAALPPPREGVTVVDLTTMSYDDMLAAARETVKPGLNPFDALLPEQPGVRRSRQAFISGQAPLPKKHKGAEVDAAEASFQLGEYLAGKRRQAPWDALCVTRPPVMAGQELDVRALHEAVAALGGYDAVTTARQWPRVRDALGIDPYVNANGVLRGHYQRLLLRHDRQAAAAGGYSTRQAARSSLGADGGGADDRTAAASGGAAVAAAAADTQATAAQPGGVARPVAAQAEAAGSGQPPAGPAAASLDAGETPALAAAIGAVQAAPAAPGAAAPQPPAHEGGATGQGTGLSQPTPAGAFGASAAMLEQRNAGAAPPAEPQRAAGQAGKVAEATEADAAGGAAARDAGGAAGAHDAATAHAGAPVTGADQTAAAADAVMADADMTDAADMQTVDLQDIIDMCDEDARMTPAEQPQPSVPAPQHWGLPAGDGGGIPGL